MKTIEISNELEDLIPEYLENRFQDLKVFRKSLDSDDFKTIEELSHKIAGHAGGYGFKELGEIAAKIEQKCQNDKKSIVQLIDKMENYLNEIDVKFVDKSL